MIDWLLKVGVPAVEVDTNWALKVVEAPGAMMAKLEMAYAVLATVMLIPVEPRPVVLFAVAETTKLPAAPVYEHCPLIKMT